LHPTSEPAVSSSHDELFLQVQQSLAGVATLADLEDVRVRFLGKKGVLTERLKELGRADPEQRRVLGQQLNELREKVLNELERVRDALQSDALEARLRSETIDVSLPGRVT
jgi:phenylalanyl-tRNA synthetase alpha chain